jgi:hypothetical protein
MQKIVYFCNLQKTTHSKQPPIRRRFAQSGHPAYNIGCQVDFAFNVSRVKVFMEIKFNVKLFSLFNVQHFFSRKRLL